MVRIYQKKAKKFVAYFERLGHETNLIRPVMGKEDDIFILRCWGQKLPTMMPTDCSVRRTPTILSTLRFGRC